MTGSSQLQRQLSKSKFVAGVQCLKRLYLQVHLPELATEMEVLPRNFGTASAPPLRFVCPLDLSEGCCAESSAPATAKNSSAGCGS